MKKIVKVILSCVLIGVFLWVGTILADRHRLNEELIRLHVVANSDSEKDQELKLRVRDAMIDSLRQSMADIQDTEKAKEYLRENLPKLQNLANAVLDAAGSTQKAIVTLCKEGFPARQYDTFSLPAGVYEALRVTIGDGNGRNWWCVVYPSLCVPQTSEGFSKAAFAAGFPQTLSDALAGEESYQIRFYLLDKLGDFEKFLSERDFPLSFLPDICYN